MVKRGAIKGGGGNIAIKVAQLKQKILSARGR